MHPIRHLSSKGDRVACREYRSLCALFNTLRSGTYSEYGTVKCNTMWHGALQCSTDQYGIFGKYRAVRYLSERNGIVVKYAVQRSLVPRSLFNF